jgi:hypothetical protein
MRNLYRAFMWGLILIGFGIAPHLARAETIAATAAGNSWRYGSNGPPWYATTVEAFAAYGGCAMIGLPTFTYDPVDNRCESGGSASGPLNNWYTGPALYTCPSGQNWTLSGTNCTRPDCTAQQVRNSSTGVCEAAPCLSTSSAGAAQWYDMGTSPDAIKKFVCVGGCMALYSGDSVCTPAIVEGFRHYYAYGGYDYSGAGAVDGCTAGAEVPAAPSGSTEIPVSHCASNQIEGLIDGKLNCWNVPSVAGEAPTLANPDAAVSTTGTSTTTVNTVGDVTTTTTTTTNNNGVTTIQTQACTGANCTTTTETTGADQTDDPDATSPGAGASTSDLYTADDTGKTFGGSIATFKSAFAATPLYSQATGFFSMAGLSPGACSGMVADFSILGNSVTLDATSIFCGPIMEEMMGYLHIGLLLIFSAIAFSIAFL